MSNNNRASKLTPDYSHRIGLSNEVDSTDLIDNVDSITDQINAIILLLTGQFENNDSKNLSNSVIFASLCVVQDLVHDIRAITADYHEKTRNKA